jgi:glycosyltransferase involved in cell wall biosynthesis
MKVGFVLSQPFGRSIGTDVRINGLIDGLSQLGVEVHVITPFGEKISIHSKNVFVHGLSPNSTKISNLKYRLSKGCIANPFLFKKVFCRESLLHRNARSLGEAVYEVARKLGLDILQAEQQIASLACISVRENLNVPVVADFHGVWAEELVASGLISYDDQCYQTICGIEREIACSADVATVVSAEMKSYVESSFGASASNVVVIPNAAFPRVDSARFVESPSKVIHSGTLHPWENSELFIEAMPYVLKRYPSAKFYFTRKGTKLKKIMKLAESLHVSPEFVWFEHGGDFLEFLKSCDIGVISSTTHLARKMAYPAKLYDYLSVGLPVVANDIGAWTNIIKKYEVGVVTANDPKAFAEGILVLLENPTFLYECAERGVALVKRELNYYKTAETLYRLYMRLLNTD